MNRTRIAFVLVASAVALPAFAQSKAPPPAGTGMKPGVWEIVSVIQSPDSQVKKTVTSRLCYGAADVAAVPRMLPPQRGLGMQCEAADVKAGEAASWNWKLACSGKEGAYAGTGSLRSTPVNYSAKVSLEQKRGAKGSKIDQSTTGRWVSDCS